MHNNLIEVRELAKKEDYDKDSGSEKSVLSEQPAPPGGPSPGGGSSSPRKKD